MRVLAASDLVAQGVQTARHLPVEVESGGVLDAHDDVINDLTGDRVLDGGRQYDEALNLFIVKETVGASGVSPVAAGTECWSWVWRSIFPSGEWRIDCVWGLPNQDL